MPEKLARLFADHYLPWARWMADPISAFATCKACARQYGQESRLNDCRTQNRERRANLSKATLRYAKLSGRTLALRISQKRAVRRSDWTAIIMFGRKLTKYPLKSKKLKIISGCDRIRFKSFVNHQIFSDLNACHYGWHWMINPTDANPYVKKIIVMYQNTSSYEWLFWLDDDAFFTDFSWRITRYIKHYNDYDLIICKSPINEGRWTWISSGQFFLRCSAHSTEFLRAVMDVNLEQVKEWWDTSTFGLATGGDQDALVYV